MSTGAATLQPAAVISVGAAAMEPRRKSTSDDLGGCGAAACFREDARLVNRARRACGIVAAAAPYPLVDLLRLPGHPAAPAPAADRKTLDPPTPPTRPTAVRPDNPGAGPPFGTGEPELGPPENVFYRPESGLRNLNARAPKFARQVRRIERPTPNPVCRLIGVAGQTDNKYWCV
jgi:hypothetical protein